MKIQLNLVLPAIMVGANASTLRNLHGEARRTQKSDEEAGPHEGCKLLLNDKHDPQPALVGAAYEGTVSSNSNYHVADEAGATAATCNNGQAGGYACNNIDLLSMIPLSGLKQGGSQGGNDIWGWTHAESGREFAIFCLREGTSFVEITDEYNPVVVGFLATKTSNSSWRDAKTMGNYALIVSEASGHGMQVFDMTQLLTATPGTVFSETAHYGNFGNAHNVFVNEDTEYAYAVGTSTCNGGLHIVAMNNPQNPVSAGCYSSDGYTHDVQCVTYNGPDSSYSGREICFASNEDTVTIIDVTDKSNMVQLARKSYSGDRYTHQGWLTEDHRYFFFNDELDEYYSVSSKTRTHAFDVTDLNNPVYAGYHDGRTAAIDHNLYVKGDYVFQANYRAGLNVLKIVEGSEAEFEEAGYFDIYPSSDSSRFNGAWSTYPYFPSGKVIVSGIEQGLFVLNFNDGSAPTTPPTPPPTTPQTPPPTASQTPPPTSSPVEQPTGSPPTQSPATWGIDRVDQRDLPLNNEYSVSGDGSGVTAYIIDTGIQISHNEFKDDSGQPRAFWGANTSGDGDNRDCNGHGTHVAGTVGGRTYGVAKNVELIAVKVLTCGGSGSTTGVINGIDWALNHAANNNKVATANLSLGGGASTAMDLAVKRLHESGVVTVVAAGNSNMNACNASPAREPTVITVGSTTNTDARSSFSNYGNCVDIFAPGSSITAAWIGNDSATRTISGTSMASPHVCGGAALLLGNDMEPETVESEIMGKATPGKVTNPGSGSPNKLLFVGEMGPTNSPTPAPPTNAPTPCQESTIVVDIKTDNYPLETSWTLTNECTGQQLASQAAGYYSNPGTEYSEEHCAPAASYTFEISDTYSDGICCSYGSGSYKVTYNGVVAKEGGQFQSSESTTFGSCNTSPTKSPTVSPTKSPTVSPSTSPTASPSTSPTEQPVDSPVVSPVESPIESPVEDEEWEEIFEEGFENGSSDYFKNMAKRLSNNSNKANNGEYSARIKKKQKFVSKNQLIGDLGFSELKIDFFYLGENMDANEGFALHYKLQGSPWTLAGVWKQGDFVNGEWSMGTVTFPTNGKNKVMFRFAGQANKGNERIYLDDITLSGK